MGFLELFGGGKGRLAKHIARARNKDAQSADRFSSLEVLRDDGSPEAVEGLLSRFTIRYDKSIEDEQEKQFVFDELVKMGGKILPQLQKHVRNAESISWGLKVLQEVASTDEAWPILADLCERNDNTYTRDPSKKIQLLVYLGEHSDPRAVKALLPYLTDMDEGVRFVTVEALLRHKNVELAREPLLKLLTNEKEESRRIKKRILDGFADLGWDVKGYSGTVEKMLDDMLPGSRLDNHGKIKRKQV
jgi:thioredoxin-like negative regulator of GroEL